MSAEKVTPEFMFDALALIAGGGLGLTVIEKIFTKKEKNETVTPVETDQKTMCACGSASGSCGKCSGENIK